jgi:hypothetical protein
MLKKDIEKICGATSTKCAMFADMFAWQNENG